LPITATRSASPLTPRSSQPAAGLVAGGSAPPDVLAAARERGVAVVRA
jgi:hypothetical protein